MCLLWRFEVCPLFAIICPLVRPLRLPMSQAELQEAVQGLLNGKNPKECLRSGEKAKALAMALSARIDEGVAPSRCAHAMCCSSNSGIVAVVRMLSARPMSTFNKAYHFGEPLRRACRAFAREEDPKRQKELGECASLIVAAAPPGSLDQPDKYLKSGLSAAESLTKCGTSAAMELLVCLRERAAVFDTTSPKTVTNKIACNTSYDKNTQTIKTEIIKIEAPIKKEPIKTEASTAESESGIKRKATRTSTKMKASKKQK